MRLPRSQFAARDRHPNHFAEVIETSTTEFLAQCLEPEDLSFAVMPPFGSWVKSVDEESGNQVYAVVYHATTSPIDSVHRARALGLSLQDLREQQPQIFAMLKTEFRAAIVGFQAPPRSPTTMRCALAWRRVTSITKRLGSGDCRRFCAGCWWILRAFEGTVNQSAERG